MDVGTVNQIILGGLVGLFPILLTSLLSWSDKRSNATKQQKALEMAKNRIDFIERWVKVQEALNSTERFEEIKQESADELARIRKELSVILDEDKETIDDREKPLFQRAFLLYRPYSFLGWVMHLAYYFFLIITIGLIIDLRPGVDFATDIFTWERVFFIDLPIMIVYAIPMLIIRAIALGVDRNATKKLNATGSG